MNRFIDRVKNQAARLGPHRLPILLAALAVGAYAPAIGWGIPEGQWVERFAWGFDEQLPIAGIQELHHTITGSPGHTLYYPMFHFKMLALWQTPYFLILWLTGSFPGGFDQLPAEILRVLTFSGRFLSVLLGAGTVATSFYIGQTLWDRTRGILAAVFTGLMHSMFYYSRTGNVDVPALFWTVLGILVYARMLRFGITLKRCVALAILAAAAAGTKDGHFAVFVFMPILVIWLQYTASPRQSYPPAWKIIAVMAAVGLAAYACTTGFVLGPRRFIDHVKFITHMGDKGPVYYGKPATVAGYIAAAQEFVASIATNIGIPMLATGVAGFFLMPKRFRWALVLPAASYVLLIIVPLRLSLVRYVMPVAFIGVLFAAYACGRILQSTNRSWRIAGIPLTAAICLPLVVYDIELTYEMMRDSRHAAAAWIDSHSKTGDPIGFFGPSTGLRPSVPVEFTRLLPFHGTDLAETFTVEEINAMVETVRASKANTVLVISSNWTAESPHGTACPAGLYQKLADGSAGFRLVETIQTPPLAAFMKRPMLDDRAVNPPIDVFVRDSVAGKL